MTLRLERCRQHVYSGPSIVPNTVHGRQVTHADGLGEYVIDFNNPDGRERTRRPKEQD